MQTHKIIIRLRGGVGNQLFQYAAGRSIALETQRRLCYETYHLERKKTRSFAMHMFNTQWQREGHISCYLLKATRKKHLYPSAMMAMKILHGFDVHYIYDQHLNYEPSIIHKTGTLILDGYWASYRYFENHQDTIRSDLTLTTGIPNSYQEYWNEIHSRENAIAVHVRRGDYVDNPRANARHGTCSLDYYFKAMKWYEEHVQNPWFYFFSDDIHWVKKNLLNRKNITLIYTDNTLGDYEDLRLMSSCRHFITANSTFSWWGAW